MIGTMWSFLPSLVIPHLLNIVFYSDTDPSPTLPSFFGRTMLEFNRILLNPLSLFYLLTSELPITTTTERKKHKHGFQSFVCIDFHNARANLNPRPWRPRRLSFIKSSSFLQHRLFFFFFFFFFLFSQTPLHHPHPHHFHCLINILRLRLSLLLFKTTTFTFSFFSLSLLIKSSSSLQTQTPRRPPSLLRRLSFRLPIQSPNSPHFPFDR